MSSTPKYALRRYVAAAIPLLDLKAQYANIRGDILGAIERVIESQNFILGPEVEALEGEIAAYSQCEFGIGVSSGTDALLVSLMALDLKAGDEVISPSFSFFATAGCIARLGAKPVFVDIDPQTYNLDTRQLESLINKKTRAIIPVHLYGQMANMEAIRELARHRKLYVVEDAAQALGAEQNRQRAGSIGDFGCFSFFPSKNLGGFGDGGMVTTSDPALADRIKLLRNHGYRPKYYNKTIGGNFRLDAIQAAVLRVKLGHLDDWTTARQANAANYRRLFTAAGLASVDVVTPERTWPITLPFEVPQSRHVYNQFVIRCKHRDKLMAHLARRGIGVEIYYPVPLHLQECFADLGYRKGQLPVSELAAAETFALPIYPELTEAMQNTIVEAFANFYSEKAV